jgi:hypothetical protein
LAEAKKRNEEKEIKTNHNLLSHFKVYRHWNHISSDAMTFFLLAQSNTAIKIHSVFNVFF